LRSVLINVRFGSIASILRCLPWVCSPSNSGLGALPALEVCRCFAAVFRRRFPYRAAWRADIWHGIWELPARSQTALPIGLVGSRSILLRAPRLRAGLARYERLWRRQMSVEWGHLGGARLSWGSPHGKIPHPPKQEGDRRTKGESMVASARSFASILIVPVICLLALPLLQLTG
jgi:hypothetical protein